MATRTPSDARSPLSVMMEERWEIQQYMLRRIHAGTLPEMTQRQKSVGAREKGTERSMEENHPS